MNLTISKTNNRNTLIILLCLFLVGAIGLGGIKAYSSIRPDRVYAVGQAMKFPAFTVKVTRASLNTASLPLNEAIVSMYGGINVAENCDTFSKDPIPDTGYLSMLGASPKPPKPSPYNFCNRRNDSRTPVVNYLHQNKQLNIDYIINSKGIVDTKLIKITILPDSGRDVKKEVDDLKANEFLYDNLLKDESGEYNFSQYVPYSQSELGGNINPGLSRMGSIITDVRNSEKIADISFSYKLNNKIVTRITRIQLHKSTY